MPAVKKQPGRARLVDDALHAFVDLVLARPFTDVPEWFDAELTISQLRALILLAYRGALTVGALAEALELGNPGTSILVQQLVERELVERAEDARDRRRTLVRLTARGAALVSGRRERREAALRGWLSRLSDGQLAALLRGLRPLAAIARAEAQPVADDEPAAEGG